MDIQAYLNKIVHVFRERLDENLVGVYLHGSLAMGCFNPDKSDVDLLVIIKNKIPYEKKKCIVNEFLNVTRGRKNQLEMSIILEDYLHHFVHPTPFELHYFHSQYLTDKNYVCGGDGFDDPDLAGHIVVTYERGMTLYGEEIKKIFKPIEQKYYIDSIVNDIKDAPAKIGDNPVYFTLNLCRVLYYLKEGAVSSKAEAGEWAVANLPGQYRKLVNHFLYVYKGQKIDSISFNNNELTEFANSMIDEISKQVTR
ncbi:aminoglycoside adenylyltransferase domain-containing protein [Evansella halocellulosilytica]|uniref:aminoglycoside adenylyltransferase domain-containing protein n=1 Tax=Evansella halocellulosilytica TaxID=2011013 RepID=UPI000BB97E28|nr:aminoglycoside adenylyltransferase domain-containing protein [Evansella halocellulosilytica]